MGITVIIIVFVVVSVGWTTFILLKFKGDKIKKDNGLSEKATDETENNNVNFTFSFAEDPTAEEIKQIAEHYIEFNEKLQVISKKSRNKDEILETTKIKPNKEKGVNLPEAIEEEVDRQKNQTPEQVNIDPKTPTETPNKTEKKQLDLQSQIETNDKHEESDTPEDVLGDNFNY